jgi:hypothetical protein
MRRPDTINHEKQVKKENIKNFELNNPNNMYLENIIQPDISSSNSNIPFSQDIYPSFKGLEEPSSGPAPF